MSEGEWAFWIKLWSLQLLAGVFVLIFTALDIPLLSMSTAAAFVGLGAVVGHLRGRFCERKGIS